MLIVNYLKGKLKSKQKINAFWIVTKIQEILKTPIHKSEKPIFLFRKTHEAAFSNSKIRKASKSDLSSKIAVKKNSSKLQIIITRHSGLKKIILLSQIHD